MAIGWLKVIQSVPWSDVISNAPKVADGAKGLWDRVAKKTGIAPEADAPAPTQDTAPMSDLAQLQAEIAQWAQRQQQLQAQLSSATELLNTLAQQNQQLVQRVDQLHSRLRWLWVLVVWVCAGGCVVLWKLDVSKLLIS